MKKLLALALVIVMVLSMVPSAFAADPTYTITINGHAPNHTYEAYQIFTGTLDSSGVVLAEPLSWGTGIDSAAFVNFLKNPTPADAFKEGTNPNIFAGIDGTASSVVDILGKYADKDAMVDTFAKYAGNFLTTPSGVATNTTGTTYEIKNLTPGYYLIRDSLTNPPPAEDDFSTKFILEVVADVKVTPKGSVPTVNKTVSDKQNGTYGETALTSIGTPVWFELNASLPSNFEIFDTYKMTFEDTMSKGLTLVLGADNVFDQNDVKAYVQRTSGVLDEIPATFYTVSAPVTDPVSGETSFDVTFPNIKAAGFPTLLAENKIVVQYQAKLNENAVISSTGNPNYVDLKYSNDPYSNAEGETGPDDALVFTFGMDMDKYDKADTAKKLNGAEFILYTRAIEKNALGVETLTLRLVAVKDGVFDGWVEVKDVAIGSSTAENWANAKELLTEDDLARVTLTTKNIDGVDGQISIKGLEPHVYHVLETKAPDGYNLPKDPFKVTIEPVYDATGKYTGMKYEYGSTALTEKANNHIEIDIGNAKGTILPSTGGMGTTLFYAIGGIMVLAAVVLLMTKKRMSVA